jgi:hypothetical protein
LLLGNDGCGCGSECPRYRAGCAGGVTATRAVLLGFELKKFDSRELRRSKLQTPNSKFQTPNSSSSAAPSDFRTQNPKLKTQS